MRNAGRGLRSLGGWLSRQRATIVLVVLVALTSSGTALAASFALGVTNTVGQTTTLKSGANGAVLQLTNTNGTGTSVRGLSISVASGKPPITVNAGAGKATNLNADKLDGLDSTSLARGSGVQVLSNRMSLFPGRMEVPFLSLGPLGELKASCEDIGSILFGYIEWHSQANGHPYEAWTNYNNDQTDARMRRISLTNGELTFASHFTGDGNQWGGALLIGTGGSVSLPEDGPLRTASIDAGAYAGASQCSLQATVTIWTQP